MKILTNRMFHACARPVTIALLAATLVTATASADEPRDEFTIEVMTAPFGTSPYYMYTALESFIADRHDWLRVRAIETPGWVQNSTEMSNEPDIRETTLSALSPATKWLAEKGERPWRDELDFDGWKALYGETLLVGYFVTLDSSIQSTEDLADTRLGLGRPTQTIWSVIPTMFLEQGHGLELSRVDHLGPTEATTALLDGTVNAAVITDYFTGDFQNRIPPPAMNKLEASGRDFYYVPYATPETVEAINDPDGGPFLDLTIPEGTMPNQTEPVTTFGDLEILYVHEDFPEDIAYELVKFVIEHQEELAEIQSIWRLADSSTWLLGLTRDDLHPGAIRAYEEAGIEIPE